MIKFLSITALCASLVFGAAFVTGNSHTEKEKRTVTVSGDGVSSAVPDTAFIRLGVISEGDTVGKATKANKESMTLVFTTLKNAKVDDKDVCTSDFGITPKYKYVQNDEAKLVGYIVNNELVVTVRDLDRIGTLLDSLTVDANRVSNISFDVLEKEKVTDLARASAMKDAFKKAKLLTETAGSKVGKVLSISENVVHRPHANHEAGATRSMASGSTPLAKGERKIKVLVHVVYEIVD